MPDLLIHNLSEVATPSGSSPRSGRRQAEVERRRGIRRYTEEKPKGKFGRHKYSAEEWGFDPAELRERMRPYTEHYGVILES